MSECLIIEKNVVMPNKRARRKLGIYKAKYPWRLCTELNDSFIAKEDDLNKVLEAAKKFCQRNKEFKFEARVMEDGKIRVWRVSK